MEKWCQSGVKVVKLAVTIKKENWQSVDFIGVAKKHKHKLALSS